jgi:NhaP-type Na+/H+ or K+/H+ antiporter
MEPNAHPELTVALALAAGILAQSVSRLIRFPGIVLLLSAGALLGPEGLGWLQPRALGDGLFGIVEFGVAIILFEGGLNLQWSRLKRQEAPIRRLITTGALVTLVGAAVLATLVLGWSLHLALLFGALVVVTGPTVIQPLLRDMRLRPRVKTVLEAEGVLIDPIGALAAGFILQFVVAPRVMTLASETLSVIVSIGFGLVVGLAAGFLLAVALRYRRPIAAGHENVFTLASVVLLFEACNTLIEPSGLVAVTVAGVVIGNMETRVGHELREFKDQLTVLLVGMLFILLAADVALADIRALGRGGAIVVAGLILVVRPLCVWFATRDSRLTTKERIFVGAIAPRGIVAAAIASVTAAALDSQGVDGGTPLRALVFSTIAGTVMLSGLLAYPLAWILDLRLPRRDRIAILGAHGLGVPLGDALRDGGLTVSFIEPDPRRSHTAEQSGHTVVFGDPLDERTLQRARMELVDSVVGLTFNEHANSLFVREAREHYGVKRAFVAMHSTDEQASQLVRRAGVSMLFDGPHDQARWDVRWRHGELVVGHFEYRPDAAEEAPPDSIPLAGADPRSEPQEPFAFLTVQRGRRIGPYHAEHEPQPGDRSVVALHTPVRDEARRMLAATGWQPVEERPLLSPTV